MDNKKYTWEYDEDTEFWNHDIFDTVEECIQDAIENYLVKQGETIAVGEVCPYEIYVNADSILEYMEEDAYEECGEVAESWQPSAINQKDIDELSNCLYNIVKEWLEEHNSMPDFCTIKNIKTIHIPG